jgi:hypothetical protein
VVEHRRPCRHWLAKAAGRRAALPRLASALADIRRHVPASVTYQPGAEGSILLGTPLDGAGTAAIVAEFPATRAVAAEDRDLFSLLASHLAQVLAKARDYEQARTVALTLQHAILGPTQLPAGFAARYMPAVEPLEVGGDWYDVVPLPGQCVGVVVGDCVGRGVVRHHRSSCRNHDLQQRRPSAADPGHPRG